MWLYDVFDSPWYYDVLDDVPGTVYVQQGTGALALSGGATQEWPGAYEQPLDCELGLYGGAIQSFVPPAAAQAYLQQGNLVLILVGGSHQEHTPVAAGEDGQTGNGMIFLSGGAFQQYVPGANPGDIAQFMDGVVSLLGGAQQSHVLPMFNRSVTVDVASIPPYSQAPVPPVLFSFGAPPPPSVSYISLQVESTDPLFETGVGPGGGELFIEIALRASARVPLASVSAARPKAEFFLGQSGSGFDAMAAAVLQGNMQLELRAYEARATSVTGVPLQSSSVTAEVLP